MSVDVLIHRYLEDRAGLAPTELDALIAGLRADPQLAASLREQLLLDDLLAQKFALDRRNFEAQVAQRVADFDRGQEQLQAQVADLRAMALAEQQQSLQAGRRRWGKYVLALAALAIVGVSLYIALPIRERRPPLATVVDVNGDVQLKRNGESAPAKVAAAVQEGEQVIVPRDGSLLLKYPDSTEIHIKEDSAVTFGSPVPTPAKHLRIDRGQLVANVAPQRFGDMQITTPHAVARVNGAKLRLVVVEDEHTLLDVSEGKVNFDRIADSRSIIVTASETGIAARDVLQTRQLIWPDRRDGLTYLLSPLETCEPDNDKPLMVARNPDTRNMRVAALEARGDAALLESRLAYELKGGHLISAEAGADIFELSRGRLEMSLEAVFAPASLDQTGPARIVALADNNEPPNFTLSQDGGEVTFLLRTDTDLPKDLPRLAVHSSESPFHLTITYRSGELIAYLEGMEIARSKNVLGSLAPWRSGPLTAGADASGERSWRGVLEALAVYNRCLEPGEVLRNAQNYRLLARREM